MKGHINLNTVNLSIIGSLKWVNGWVFVVLKCTLGLFQGTHLDQVIANERSEGGRKTIPSCGLQMLLILFKMRNYNWRQNCSKLFAVKSVSDILPT